MPRTVAGAPALIGIDPRERPTNQILIQLSECAVPSARPCAIAHPSHQPCVLPLEALSFLLTIVKTIDWTCAQR